MKDIIKRLSTQIVFHPYFLFFRAEDRLYKKLLTKYASGVVLDVGCGTCYYKPFILGLRNVIGYIGVDYPEWLYNFERCHSVSEQLGVLGKLALRNSSLKANIYGDGCLLGIKNESVDTGISIGVLEHVDEPIMYLKEIYRVIKKRGIFFITIPFLYGAHGADEASSDFFRWTKSGIIRILKNTGFAIEELSCYGKTGTMFSQLLNSFIIKRLDVYNTKKNLFLKVCKVILMTPCFFLINMIGTFLDMIGEDSSYSSGFCVVASKP